MRLRYPDQNAKNALRLMPVFLLILAIPLGIMMINDYLQGPRDNHLIPIFTVIFAIYFSFRAYHAVKIVFLFGDEEAS